MIDVATPSTEVEKSMSLRSIFHFFILVFFSTIFLYIHVGQQWLRGFITGHLGNAGPL